MLPPGSHFKITKKKKSGFELYIEVIVTYNYEDFADFALQEEVKQEAQEEVIFAMNNGIGDASYHFNHGLENRADQKECYISYKDS